MGGGLALVWLAVAQASPIVDVTTGEVRWNAIPLVRLDAGRIARAALDGHAIRRLDEAARPVFRAIRVAMREPGERVSAGVRAESSLTWGVVARVMLTLRLAGADRINVEVTSVGRSEGANWGTEEAATRSSRAARKAFRVLARHRGIKWSAHPTIWLTRQGYSVYTHPSGRVAHRLRARGRDWIGVLMAIREVFAGESGLAIMAEDSVPLREMAEVRAVARRLGFLEARFRPGLFR